MTFWQFYKKAEASFLDWPEGDSTWGQTYRGKALNDGERDISLIPRFSIFLLLAIGIVKLRIWGRTFCPEV